MPRQEMSSRGGDWCILVALPATDAYRRHPPTDALEAAARMQIPRSGVAQVVDREVDETGRALLAELGECGNEGRDLHEAADDSAMDGWQAHVADQALLEWKLQYDAAIVRVFLEAGTDLPRIRHAGEGQRRTLRDAPGSGAYGACGWAAHWRTPLDEWEARMKAPVALATGRSRRPECNSHRTKMTERVTR